ncbi:MAG: hypothetical protein JXQ77_02905 [Campylobacterales bacterium]|nr:hypothetical protein [Campylobacterales bacterium]
MSLQQYIISVVTHPRLPLKDEMLLKEVLKRRLTKKEYKILDALVYSKNTEEVCAKLKLDVDRYNEVVLTLTKKLNQEKLKQELAL